MLRPFVALGSLFALFPASSLFAEIASLWHPSARLLIIGEQHDSVAHAMLVRTEFPKLAAAGMRHLAIETPSLQQNVLDRFVTENRTLGWLSEALWQTPFASLPAPFRLKLELIETARAHRVRLWAIDGDATLFHRLGSLQLRAAGPDSAGALDPTGRELVRLRGPLSECLQLAPRVAAQRARALWLNGRTQSMAENVDRLAAAFPNERVVLLVGNLHADLAAFRGLFGAAVELEGVRDDSIEDYLSPTVRAATQTLALQGGFPAEHATRLLPLERHARDIGWSDRTLCVAKVGGYRAIDSVIVLPLQLRVEHSVALQP